MKIINVIELQRSDLIGAVATRRAGALVTIYYEGDSIPPEPEIADPDAAARQAFETSNAATQTAEFARYKISGAKDEADTEAARQYAKLQNLIQMSPAQVQTWVAANVTNLAQAQDAIATLAIAVSVLARRL